MNLALIVEQFHRFDTTGRLARNLVRGLSDRGHQLTVICGGASDREDWPEVEIAVLDEDPGKLNWHPPRLRRLADEQLETGRFDGSVSLTTLVPADIVQPVEGTIRQAMHGSTGSWITRARYRLARLVNPFHGYRRALEKRTLASSRPRRFIAESEAIARELSEQHAIDDSRIELIRPGSALAVPDETQRQAWRQRVRDNFRIDDQAVVYLFPDSHRAIHGLDSALDAIGRLRDGGLNAVLMLVGGAGFEVNQRLAAQETRPGVRIVGHSIHLAGLYSAADVSVFPTRSDAGGRAVIDALRVGVPVVTSRHGGAGSLVSCGDQSPAGVVLDEVSDREALTRAMSDLADPAHRRPVAEAAAHQGQSLGFETYLDRVEALFSAAVGQSPRTNP